MMKQVFTYSKLGKLGSLGNQLFELAGVVGEAHKAEIEVSFPEWDYAKYFNIPEEYFEEKDAIKIDFWPSHLQNMTHFKDVEVVIRDILSASDYSKYLLADRFPWDYEPGPIVGVHVKRSPLLHDELVCTLDYYEEALDGVVYNEMLVCSDDIEWCAKHSLFKNAHFGMDVDEEAVIDLLMLVQCDSHVLSNSSFSWWAGWLGDGDATVYPENWFVEKSKFIDKSIMFPEEWIPV